MFAWNINVLLVIKYSKSIWIWEQTCVEKHHRATSWENQHNDLCAQRRLISLTPSLIRVFAVRMKKTWVLSYPLRAQQRLWCDWADAQADLSLRWVHSHFVGFVMRRLIKCFRNTVNLLMFEFGVFSQLTQGRKFFWNKSLQKFNFLVFTNEIKEL